MTLVESEEDARNSDPRRLYEEATASQARWAKQYVLDHCRRRRVAWALATCLTICLAVGIFHMVRDTSLDGYLVVIFYSATPLSCIYLATSHASDSDPIGEYWAISWTLYLISAAGFILADHSSRNLLYGLLQAMVALIVPAILAWGLHIPADPSIDWELAQFDFLRRAESSKSSGLNSYHISDYGQAEEVAAAWLRRLGYSDAKVSNKTSSGHDDGIDVQAARAAAQVKYWKADKVRIKDVQRLAGSAEPWQDKFFFSSSGYTRNAMQWAARSDQRVALFVMQPSGNLVADNYYAKRALWFAKSHVPSRLAWSSRPSWAEDLSVILGLALLVLSVLLFSFGVFAFAFHGQRATPEALIFGIFFTFLLPAFVVSLLWKSLRRLVRAVSRRFHGEEWPGWREILREPRREFPDAGLPPDEFYGFEGVWPLRIFAAITDLASYLRLRRRFISKRFKLNK